MHRLSTRPQGTSTKHATAGVIKYRFKQPDGAAAPHVHVPREQEGLYANAFACCGLPSHTPARATHMHSCTKPVSKARRGQPISRTLKYFAFSRTLVTMPPDVRL
eukprot:XP_001693772.1 predicted protein [Chlamydomonas reinhardtii]